MAKGNCRFNGTGGQYFGTVLIHLFLLSGLTLGLYSPWAWAKVFRLKASHTTINGKPVTFTGSGMDLLVLVLIQGLLTMVTFGLYFPWAICKFFSWRTRNTLVDGKPGQFTGTGQSLFIFYLIHLMILPILTLGIYYFWGFYRFYAWKEEHTRYGGEKTTFGAGFGEFLKISLISYALCILTLNLFLPWAMGMLFKWQINGLAVGDGEDVEHFPPVKTNLIVVIVIMAIGLIVFLAIALLIKGQVDRARVMQAQMERMERMQMAVQKREKARKAEALPRVAEKPPERGIPEAVPQPGAPSPTMPAEEQPTAEVVDFESEMNALNALIDKNQKDVNAFYNRAWLHAFNKDLESAEKDYSWAIQVDEKNADAHYNRGLLYIKMEKYDLAIKDLSEAIRWNPTAVDAYCNRGNTYHQLGKTNLALQDYNAALKMDPNDADLYYNRAVVSLGRGEEQKATRDFQKAAQMGHKKAREHLGLPPAITETPETPEKTSSARPSVDLGSFVSGTFKAQVQ